MTTKNMVVEVQKELNICEQELGMILNKLDMGIDELHHYINEGEHRIFSSHKELFFWVHEDSDINGLIEHMYEGTTGLGNDSHYIFSDGRALFIFK